MDSETLAHFLQVRRDEGVAPDRRASPVLELVVEHLTQFPATVFTRSGEVLLQTRPAIALFGDYTRTGGSSRSLVDRWLSDPSARDRYLVEVGIPARHRLRSYRHVDLGALALYRHLLICPPERQVLLVFTAVPGSTSDAKLRAPAAVTTDREN
jgi:hypothetical protein